MDELIDILDADGKPTKRTAMKSVAHREGLFHPTVHVWLYTNNGQILLQKRSKTKDTHPLLWDVSVAGHIAAGEDIEESALREVQEEIGLSLATNDLQKIGIFKSVFEHSPSLIDCEFHHTYLCELKVPLKQLKRQESEVEDLQLILLTHFSKDIRDKPELYVPHDMNYYRSVIQAIKRKL